MAAISEFFGKLGKDMSDNYAKTASHVEGRAAASGSEGAQKINPNLWQHSERLATTYRDTMFGEGAGAARKIIGNAVPGVIGGGMAIGSYNEAQNGNTGAATVLGAGAVVMGGALALSHFGAVAEGGIERNVAEGVAKGIKPGEAVNLNLDGGKTPSDEAFLHRLNNQPSEEQASRNVKDAVAGANYTSHQTDDMSDAALNNARAKGSRPSSGIAARNDATLSENAGQIIDQMAAHTDSVNARVAQSVVNANTVPAKGSILDNIPGAVPRPPAVSREDLAGSFGGQISIQDLAQQHTNSGLDAANQGRQRVEDEVNRRNNRLPAVLARQFPSGVF